MTYPSRFSSKYIALVTAAIVLFSFSFYIYYRTYKKPQFPSPIPLYTKDQPTEGNPKAPIHIVVFEDPACSNCITFHKSIYPFLKRHYIDTGQVKYTVILVSFLPYSRPIAMALLCALSQSPQAFFEFLEAFYEHPITITSSANFISEQMLALSRSIDLDENLLRDCIMQKKHSSTITENTTYAKDLMGGYLQTPTLYVNGMKIIDPSIPQITAYIDYAEKHLKKKKQ